MSKPVLLIVPSKSMAKNYQRTKIWTDRLKSIFGEEFNLAFLPDKMQAYSNLTSITNIVFKDDNVDISVNCPHDKDRIDSLIYGLKYLLDNTEQFKIELEKEGEESQ